MNFRVTDFIPVLDAGLLGGENLSKFVITCETRFPVPFLIYAVIEAIVLKRIGSGKQKFLQTSCPCIVKQSFATKLIIALG